ncbi:MerR family transcriptional regulator [Paracoccus sp. p1-h21]|uniref:MerR family transcriptional regulator n=1 Tax=Paracoccus sp. p1-h21 TaxID=3366951 RepID=UPI0037878355
MDKSPDAFRSIGEVARIVGVAPHVLRYWESQFSQLSPVKRRDGRRYYRPDDLYLVAGLVGLLREDGLTIRGAKKLLSQDRGAATRARGVSRLQEAGQLPATTADAADTSTPRPDTPPARQTAADPDAQPKPVRRRPGPAAPADLPLFSDQHQPDPPAAQPPGADAAPAGANAPSDTAPSDPAPASAATALPCPAAQVLPLLADAADALRNWPQDRPLPQQVTQLRQLLNSLR